MAAAGFAHHERFVHPSGDGGFEYDFWHPGLGLAIEIMGYRADDEIYKDLLKFHVHPDARTAAVWVPRWKFVSGKRQERCFTETKKAVRFADSHLNVDAVAVLPYEWTSESDGWRLRYSEVAS